MVNWQLERCIATHDPDFSDRSHNGVSFRSGLEEMIVLGENCFWRLVYEINSVDVCGLMMTRHKNVFRIVSVLPADIVVKFLINKRNFNNS